MARDVSTRCMLENALAHLDVLAPIREGFHRENSDKIKVLLAVAKALAEECMRSSKVYLIDAFLPGYHFLFGLCSITSISAYNASSYAHLSALHPMVIYLKSDVPSAFRRAVDERGQEWFDEFLERINWHFRKGRYECASLPMSSMKDVFVYFEEMDQLLQRMVGEWPGSRLVIDTTGQTIDTIKMMLMNSLMQIESDSTPP